MVDGTSYTSTQTFTWVTGSMHALSTSEPQFGTGGVGYIFDEWSDGTKNWFDEVTASVATTSYTANFQASAGSPGAVSIAPNSGSGTYQTFVATYSDPNGVAELNALYVLFNSSIAAAHGCYVSYVPGTNMLYLKNDTGTAELPGVQLSSAETLANSQCSVYSYYSSYDGNGSLSLAITFKGTAPYNVYLLASDRSGSTSGWMQKGTWAPLGLPSVVSVTPSSGSASTQTFSAVFTDPDGGQAITAAYMLFNTSVMAAHGCYVLYYPLTNLLYLKNDAGTANSIGITPGSAATVSNSQCAISGATSSYVVSGSTATLSVALTFSEITPENIYLYAFDKNANNSGWVLSGSWTP
jgi:hypothetical protein